MKPVSQSRRALVIAEPSLVSSAFVESWLESGNTIAAFWTRDEKSLAASVSQKFVALASGFPTLDYQIKRHEIPVVRNENLRTWHDARAAAQATQADTLITLMTHQIVPGSLIEYFGHRSVNVHPALLPHYKGPRPLLCLLADGQANRFGGVTVHRLDIGIDAGPIIARRQVQFSPDRNFHVWSYKLALAAADLARNALPAYLDGSRQPVPQIEGSGNYRKSDRTEFVVEPNKTLGDIRRLFSLPAGVKFRANLGPGIAARESYAVHRIVSAISPPTGAPPKITPVALEMDIVDYRIRMPRRRQAARIFPDAALAIARYRIGHWRPRKIQD